MKRSEIAFCIWSKCFHFLYSTSQKTLQITWDVYIDTEHSSSIINNILYCVCRIIANMNHSTVMKNSIANQANPARMTWNYLKLRFGQPYYLPKWPVSLPNVMHLILAPVISITSTPSLSFSWNIYWIFTFTAHYWVISHIS